MIVIPSESCLFFTKSKNALMRHMRYVQSGTQTNSLLQSTYPQKKAYYTQKANRKPPAVKFKATPSATFYPLPTKMHPSLIDMPP